MSITITLLAKPGCHLCDVAREAITAARDELAAQTIATNFAEINILSDPKLARLHAEDIPVVLINGKRHAIWRVDPARLVAAVQRINARKR